MTELLTTGNAVSNCDSNAFEKVWNLCGKKFRIDFWKGKSNNRFLYGLKFGNVRRNLSNVSRNIRYNWWLCRQISLILPFSNSVLKTLKIQSKKKITYVFNDFHQIEL